MSLMTSLPVLPSICASSRAFAPFRRITKQIEGTPPRSVASLASCLFPLAVLYNRKVNESFIYGPGLGSQRCTFTLKHYLFLSSRGINTFI
uniref:Uncharacterized protein n=1 Tax=Anguilla anguilla TaxID=7936 RepID=A0A0E9WX89_ANGAN